MKQYENKGIMLLTTLGTVCAAECNTCKNRQRNSTQACIFYALPESFPGEVAYPTNAPLKTTGTCCGNYIHYIPLFLTEIGVIGIIVTA
jgi:hypothetical protein